MSTEREVAFHEAGHAVVGHLLGDCIKCVTIIPDGKTLGLTSWARELGGDIGARNWFAGDLAERIMRRDENITYETADRTTCDWWKALSCVNTDERKLYQDTRDHLLASWRAVEVLVRDLEERKTLQGNEAMDTIAKALKDPVDSM